MTSVVKLVQIIGASVRLEWSLDVKGAQSRINTGVTPGCPGLCSAGCRCLQRWTHISGSPLRCFFSSEWKMFSLCLDWTISISPSHPSAMQHREEPGFAGSVLLLNSLPLKLSPSLGKGQSLLPSSSWLGFSWHSPAQELLAFPAASHLTCPKQGAVWNCDWIFCPSDIQQHVSFAMRSLFREVRNTTEVYGTQRQGFRKQREQKWPMWTFLQEVSNIIKILVLCRTGEREKLDKLFVDKKEIKKGF